MGTVPIDTGWAWFIALAIPIHPPTASFGVHFAIGALVKTFGILLVEFQEKFQCSAWAINTVQGTYFGLWCAMAPVGNALSIRFSFRKVLITSGLLGTVGFVGSSLSPTLPWFFFFQGVVVGSSFGLCYGPSIVMLVYWFEKRRGMAMSVSQIGSAIGSIIMPIAMGYFMEIYGLFGTVLMQAGIMLQVCICGMLVRPMEFYIRDELNVDENETISLCSKVDYHAYESRAVTMDEDTFGSKGDCNKHDVSMNDVITNDASKNGDSKNTFSKVHKDSMNVVIFPVSYRSNETMIKRNNGSRYLDDIHNLSASIKISMDKLHNRLHGRNPDRSQSVMLLPTESSMNGWLSTKSIPQHVYTNHITHKPNVNRLTVYGPLKSKSDTLCLHENIQEPTKPKVSPISIVKNNMPDLNLDIPIIIECANDNNTHTSKQTELQNLDRDNLIEPSGQDNILEPSPRDNLLKPSCLELMIEKASYNNGELKDTDKSNMKSDDEGDENDKETEIDITSITPRHNACCLMRYFDWTLFRNPLFVIYLIGAFCYDITWSSGFYLLPFLARHRNFSLSQSTWLISMHGIADFFFRIAIGPFSDLNIIPRRYLFSGAIIIMGITAAFSSFAYTYVSISVCCIFYGITGAVTIPMANLVLADVLTQEQCSSAIGFMFFSQAFGAVMTAQITGLLFDFTGSWSPAFWFTGSVTLLGGFIACTEPLINWYRRRYATKDGVMCEAKEAVNANDVANDDVKDEAKEAEKAPMS